MLTLVSCKDDAKYPEEGVFYVFNLGSKVDAEYLGCGYEGYERCGDRVKKRVREAVGYLSDKDLVQIGNDIHENKIPFNLTTHERENWVYEIIENMKPFLDKDNFSYNAYIVDSPDFNAFTIPGGNIYVTTGVLDMVSNKHELAYIIGHELGHNENSHTKESAYLMKYRELQESEDTYYSAAKSILTSIFANSCGKSDELECDIASIYLLYKGGYDPEKALGGVDILRRISSKKTGSWSESIIFMAFGSHPWSDDRSKCVKGYVRGSRVDIGCDRKYDEKYGVVVTKKSPLNIREFPMINKARKIHKISKGEIVRVWCDCIKQPMYPERDWLYVTYTDNNEEFTGWVDKKYIELK